MQLLKAVNKLPGLSKTEVDEDAILLRAYGKGTDVLIDRESECMPRIRAGGLANCQPQRRLGRTRFSRATASHPLSTPGLKMVSYTSTFKAACVRPPICVGLRYGEG